MDQVLALWASLPQVTQVLTVYTFFLLLGMGIVYGAIKLREHLNSNQAVIVMLSNVLAAAVDGAYLAIKDQLDKMTLDQQVDAVKQLAHDLYIQFPDIVMLPMGKYSIPIPLKVLLSEDMFTNLCLGAYYKTSDALQVLRDELAKLYAQWKMDGGPLPVARIAFSLGGR